MYYLKKSLICLALPLATLTACGGGSGGSASNESSGEVSTTPTSQTAPASITTNNAQALSRAAVTNGNLSNSSISVLEQVANQLAPDLAARSNASSGSESCPSGGSVNYNMTNNNGGSFSFNSCIFNSDLALDGSFSLIGSDIAQGLTINYSGFNIKMAPTSLNNYQAMDETINGNISLSMFGDSGFTSLQNIVRQHNQTGVQINSNNIQMSFNGSRILPDQASGTLVHSEYGSVALSTSGSSLILTGDASTLKIDQQNGGFVLSIDEDNDGAFEQTATATSLDSNDLVWVAI